MQLPARASGVLLHPTSLPGPHGAGDFGAAAYRFVEWLERAGQSLWQWLPITPPGLGYSPYQSVSAFAGNPSLVALEPLAERGWLDAAELAAPAPPFDHQRVDFERATSWREARLRAAAQGFFSHAAPADRTAFTAWCAAQAHWLDDYALFMALQGAHGGAPWWQWPLPLRHRKAVALTAARRELGGEITVWKFIQWCFDTQALALKAYANAHGVALMGDVPIFVAHHSADCWARPDLYQLDADDQPIAVAGVPPDAFSADGQRWGNPLYRWPRMAAENYAWWAARLRRVLQHADLFRIDHFRGFSAHYEIPAASPTARDGRWMPGPGRALFAALERQLGRLPVIAEDLGVIDDAVRALLAACGYPGMKVLQFAFGEGGANPYLPHNYATHNCVAYSATHDNDTARGWLASATPHEREYAQRYTACGPHDIHWGLIRAAANSVAALSVYPLQDVLGLDGAHRMNRPGTMGGTNWAWRFTWEMLEPEASRVLGLICAAAGRSPLALLGLPG